MREEPNATTVNCVGNLGRRPSVAGIGGWRGVVVVLGVSCVGLAGSAALANTNTRHKASCGSPEAQTLAAIPKLRLYQLVVGPEETKVVLVCAKPGGHGHRLGPRRHYGFLGTMDAPYLLAPPWTAASESTHGIDTSTQSLVRFNVRTLERDASCVLKVDSPVSHYEIEHPLLSRRGFAAWILEHGSIRKLMACGSEESVELDHGSEIEPDSLSLRGAVLSWSKAGLQYRERLH